MSQGEDSGYDLVTAKMTRRKALSTIGKAGIGIIGVAIAGGTVYYALYTAPTATQPKAGGTLTKRIFVNPSTFNPAISGAINDHEVLSQVFNGLVALDLDLKTVKPSLAESWEISPDGLTNTFHLVKNAKWHDGKPFTSADVKFSIEQVISKLHPTGRAVFANLDVVDTPDDYPAIIRMK